MKTFGLFLLISFLTGNPLLALLILILVVFVIERRFIGVLPDIFEPWRRAGRMRQLNKEVQVNPANAEAHLDLGEAYFRQGKYKLASSFLEKASGKMAGHPLFHFYLGACYYHLGKIEEGKREIEKAVAANPKASLGEPYVYLLRICLQERQPAHIIENICKQLLNSGTPKTFYLAGRVFMEAGDINRARNFFEETIENYDACRGALKRLYRKWAILSKICLYSLK
ncbi:MAG: tetratricopeptide repeat protein [Pelotomaculaceae bacterium]|jgi:tetratricopeptide (TPR) repeat protein|uniref:Tetratricopeptide repeat protein n=1 Tax=anaerobic digester metagenome TaxID=1263854 RepID=A0A485LU10_9ZZZZ|nr:tetratricopeptide repeat protein [Bacillota bacterium]HHU86331.1 tetratricopeptide repeat protein [Peptococcaceae bacterium]